MKIKAFNIQYDTDGNKKIAARLPKELVFDVDDEDFDPEEELADLVSDETGWCIFGCDYKIIG